MNLKTNVSTDSVTRKNQHIDLTKNSQTNLEKLDQRFFYEPLLSAHPDFSNLKNICKPQKFLGKRMNFPLWISSMTGGAKFGKKINHNLAKVVGEFGLGLGLGSCRTLLESEQYLEQFLVRDLLKDAPMFANLGISQLEKYYFLGNFEPIKALVKKISADGIIIHVNPLQEWFQDEGDRLTRPAIETISAFFKDVDFLVIVKEVGQGFGPASLEALIELGVDCIEFASFGGTNFSIIESSRHQVNNISSKPFENMCYVGHSAGEMLKIVHRIIDIGDKNDNKIHQQKYPSLIISGGIKTALDGYYYTQQSKLPAVFGMASNFLTKAQKDYLELREYTEKLLEEYAMAKSFLRLKD